MQYKSVSSTRLLVNSSTNKQTLDNNKEHTETHSPAGHINIIGAREHNLKNINVSLPRHSLSVITGLSGCGKS